jgi:hypothetical protein
MERTTPVLPFGSQGRNVSGRALVPSRVRVWLSLVAPARSAETNEERVEWGMHCLPEAASVEPGPETRARMTAARRRLAAKPPPTEVLVGNDPQGRLKVGPPCADIEGWLALAREAFGTASPAFVEAEIGRMMNALASCNDGIALEMKMNAALATIEGMQPKNEVEAMLAIQMALTHATATALLCRVNRAGEHMMLEHLSVYGNIAAKLVRAFTGQVEALAKLRRPAVQVVRVERVNVADGGQAIVGAIGKPGAPTQT